jgi:DNA-binding PadR family transcriptional regulator
MDPFPHRDTSSPGAISIPVRGEQPNNRRVRFYRLTRAGRRQLQAETHDWQTTAAVIERFFAVKAEDLE